MHLASRRAGTSHGRNPSCSTTWSNGLQAVGRNRYPHGAHVRLPVTTRQQHLGGTVFRHIDLDVFDFASARQLLEQGVGRRSLRTTGSVDFAIRLQALRTCRRGFHAGMIACMDDLRGKSIIVTGATSGIGRATTLRLARLGVRLTLAGRDDKRAKAVLAEVTAEGAEAGVALGDLRRPGEADRLADAAVKAHGRIDALVHAAADTPRLDPLWALDDQDIERGLMDELRATTWLCRAVTQRVRQQEPTNASVVLVASINGLGAAPSAPLYSGLKAATIALAKSLALDGAAIGLRANALVPGAVDTPMLAAAIAAQGPAEAVRKAYEAHIPMARIGRPEEVAEVAAWLCSDVSCYVTGISLIVDGGMTAFAR